MTPRTLREELRRMNREQLTAVAENWGISDPAGRLTGSEIRDLLVPRILNSVSLREKLDEAPAGTDLALRALIGSGGRFSAVRFAAMFGSVRAMGPDRFLRDAPLAQPGIGQRVADLSWVYFSRVRGRRVRAGRVLRDADGPGPVFRRAGASDAGPGRETGRSSRL